METIILLGVILLIIVGYSVRFLARKHTNEMEIEMPNTETVNLEVNNIIPECVWYYPERDFICVYSKTMSDAIISKRSDVVCLGEL